MYRFLIMASILVLLGFVYLGHRIIAKTWPHAVQLAMWIALGAMIANLLWLPFKRWQLTQRSKSKPLRHGPIIRMLEASAYNLMGYLSLLLCFSAISEFLRLALAIMPTSWLTEVTSRMPAGQDTDSMLAVGILSLATSFFLWGRIKVAIGPRYSRVTLVYPFAHKHKSTRDKKKRAKLRKIRLVQVSDLHIGRAIKQKYVQRVVNMINGAKPDLVCFTGDIGDGSVEKLRTDAAPLSSIQSKLGVHYIPGNHEYYWGMKTWLKEFTDLAFTPVINSGVTHDVDGLKIFIAGVSDPAAARFAEELPKLPQRQPSDLAILLAHQPIFANSALQHGYDLMLSGHTHGGQYIPWSWVVHLVYKYASGLYRKGNLRIYVNDGTGYWGAPVRIGTKLEVTVMDIYFADAQAA